MDFLVRTGQESAETVNMIEIGGQYDVLVQLMYEFLSPSEDKYQKVISLH